MNVDEMDLVRQSLEVTPWRPEAYERARAVLRGVMAESGPSRRRRPARRRAGLGVGIAAVAAAAAVAVVLGSTPAPPPARPAGPQAASAGPAVRPLAATSRLTTLAAVITADDRSPVGNASLVIARQVNGGRQLQVVYALYTDDGRLYLGDDKRSLMTAVADHANLADQTNARELAAARYAAAGDLATAVRRMVDALPNDFYDSLAMRKAIWAKGAAARAALEKEKGMKVALTMPTGRALQEEIDNYLWTASTIALSWGAGNPQIRAGVLRLLSTLPEVTVADSTTGGQPTLTITAGPALFGGSGDQVLTVSARTGIPVSSVESGGGLPTAVQTDRVSRVTLAGVAAGRF